MASRESYIFYSSFYDAIRELSDSDRLILYDAINAYSLFGTPSELTGTPKALFILIKAQLDANIRRYENGLRGGRPRHPKNQTLPTVEPNNNLNETKHEPNDNQSITETQPNKNVNDNMNDNVKEHVSFCTASEKGNSVSSAFVAERERFLILEIFFERGLVRPPDEVEKFYNHYEAIGWVDFNGKPIRSRLAAAKKWIQKDSVGKPLPASFVDIWLQLYRKAIKTIPKAENLLEIYAVRSNERTKTISLTVSTAFERSLTENKDVLGVMYNDFFSYKLERIVKK